MHNVNSFELDRSVEAILSWLQGRKVTAAVTLGSGLGGFGAELPEAISTEYSKVHLPHCEVDGHAGILRFAQIHNQGVLILDGRTHGYEGRSQEGFNLDSVVRGLRAATKVGAKIHVITSSCGGIRSNVRPGDLVLTTDHLNLSGLNPLLGENFKELGPRFVDMSAVYDRELIAIAQEASSHLFEHFLQPGIMATMSGPNFETPAEITMLKSLGAAFVGMSTAIDALALRHAGAKVLAVSCVVNKAAGLTDKELSHDETKRVAAESAERFKKLLMEFFRRLP